MNWQKTYIKIVEEFIKGYKKDPNILGAVLNGGISRGTGDIYSEIDITFYVKDVKSKKLPPENDINVNGVWFDFTFLNYQDKKKSEWSMVERWDKSYAKILFEKNKYISKLFKQKIKFTKKEKNLAKELKDKAIWCLDLSLVFVDRKNLYHAHMLVSEGLNNLIDYFFIKSGHFIPHFKWKHHYFNELKLPSKKLKKEIFNSFLFKNYSEKELYKRLKKIRTFLKREGICPKSYLYHTQNLKAIENFKNSLKTRIKYENPW